jgi:cation diffusion facilitator CzcD-associated flavoprotein CzcO
MALYYGLDKSTIFNSSVISATWDEDSMVWKVLVENKKSGDQKLWTCNVVRIILGDVLRELVGIGSRSI